MGRADAPARPPGRVILRCNSALDIVRGTDVGLPAAKVVQRLYRKAASCWCG